MKNKQGQFFIISIVLLAIAMFLLMTYFLTIDESSAIMFESNSRIEMDNIKNAVNDPDNCNVNGSICPHLEQIYEGKFKLTCSESGSLPPYDYTITLKSKDFELTTDFTPNLSC
jgi:hypothetical protein